MVIDPILFYVLVAILIALAGALVALAFSYAEGIKKVHDTQKKLEELQHDEHALRQQILTDAYAKANLILDEASASSTQIIGSGHELNNHLSQALDLQLSKLVAREQKSFEATTKQLLEEYAKQLSTVKTENINVAQKMSKDIETAIDTLLHEFKTLLDKEALSTQQLLGNRVEKEFADADQTLKQYKELQMKKVDESIYPVLAYVSKQVIGKTLPLDQHEQLVIAAIEEAKEYVSVQNLGPQPAKPTQPVQKEKKEDV